MREEFQSKQTVNVFRKINTAPKAKKLNINHNTFVFLYTFSSAENVLVYTSIQGTNREKYFNHIIYNGKMPTLVGNINTSPFTFFSKTASFPSFDGKEYGSSPPQIDIKVVIPALTQKIIP